MILTRQTCGQRSSRAVESKRWALGNYFFEQICYMSPSPVPLSMSLWVHPIHRHSSPPSLSTSLPPCLPSFLPSSPRQCQPCSPALHLSSSLALPSWMGNWYQPKLKYALTVLQWLHNKAIWCSEIQVIRARGHRRAWVLPPFLWINCLFRNKQF